MYIVTGGAGFIGSALIAELNQSDIDEVLIVDNLERDSKWENLVRKSFTDIVSKEVFLQLVERRAVNFKVDAVIHLGACSSTTERDASFLLENNYRYSRILAEWALELKAPFIYASSGATYGSGAAGFSDADEAAADLRPLNMYGYSKQMFDLWALRTGAAKKIAGLKFFNVYGPNEYHKGEMASVVFKAFRQVRETGKIKLFKSCRPDYADGEQKRDFIYVKDVTAVIRWFLEHSGRAGIFNVGTGQARTWNDLAKAVFAAMGRPVAIEYIDMPPAVREHYQYVTEAAVDKLRNLGCNVPFHSLESGIEDYIKNYLSQADPFI